MVLTTRSIAPVTLPAKTYEHQSSVVLEHVAGQKVIGLLRQIGQLSDFAADIFANLLKDATETSTRVNNLTQRVVAVEAVVPVVQATYARSKPSHFYGGVKGGQVLQREPPAPTDLFVPNNLPAPIARVRGLAQPPPQLAILDSFAGKSCLSQYSDPGFFFGQWLKTEDEKNQKMHEENQAKKAARKKKKKKTGTKQPKMVAAVNVKTYSAQGKEFDDQQRQIAAQRAAEANANGQQTLASPDEEEEEDERAGPSSTAGARKQAPQYEYARQQSNYINEKEASPKQPVVPTPASPPRSALEGYAPPPPIATYVAPPPVVQQGYAPPPPIAPYNPAAAAPPPSTGGYAPPPPVRPVVEAPPVAPVYTAPAAPPMAPPTAAPVAPPMAPPVAPPAAPPMAPPMAPPVAPPMAPPMAPAFDAPAAPPMAPSMGAPSAPSMGAPSAPPMAPPVASPMAAGGLLDAIRGGATLRKAAPAPAAAPSGRSGLLGEIKNRGFQLRKVEERKEEEKAKPPIVSGAAASIAAVLARRTAISGGDSDSDGDSDDDWD